MAKATKKSKVVALLLAGIILLTMFAGCNGNTNDNNGLRETGSYKTLKENSVKLLEENGYSVESSRIVAYFDGVPVIEFRAVVDDKLVTYDVKTDYDGPIVSAFLAGQNEMMVYGDYLNIIWYFRDANYTLDGDKIVVSY